MLSCAVLKEREEEERGRAGELVQNRKGGGRGFPIMAEARGESFGPQHPKPRGDSETHSIVSHLLPLQSLSWQGEEDGGPCHGQDHQTLLHCPAASCWHRALPGQPPPLPAALLCPKGEDAFIAWVPASMWVSPPHWLGEGWGSHGQHHAQVAGWWQ